jgi:hypothetical protein
MVIDGRWSADGVKTWLTTVGRRQTAVDGRLLTRQ